MKGIIDEAEIRLAVADWLAKQNIRIRPQELTQEKVVHGQYDEQVEEFVGYSFPIQNLRKD